MKRWFAELTSRELRGSAHRSVTGLEAETRARINACNADPKPFARTKTAGEILVTSGREPATILALSVQT